MGPVEVAAWGMLGFLWDTFESLIGGFSDAAEVRVGFRLGAGQPHHAKMAAYKTLYIAVVAGIFTTSALYVLSEYIPRWLTPDPTLQLMIFECLPLIGFGNIVLVVGFASWGIVCAQGRPRLGTSIQFVASWFVVIPLCAVSFYVLNYNIVGFVAAVIFGYTLSGVLLGFIILRSDWGALSQTVISRNLIEGVTWDENGWEELPPHVQKAALLLGYTRISWNNKEEPFMNDRNWIELNPQEKEAARIMGYNKKNWNDRSDSSDNDDEVKHKHGHLAWDELPSQIKSAAQQLCYTKTIWESGQDPPTNNRTWDEMSRADQDAATILGCNKQVWGKHGNGDDNFEKRKHVVVQYEADPSQSVRGATLADDERILKADGSPLSDNKY